MEIFIAFELAHVIGFDPTEHKLRVGKKVLDVDVLIRRLSLVVEYDGSYTHRGKVMADRRKTEQLRRAGWTVVRMREEPLKPLTHFDVRVPVIRARDESAIKRGVDDVLRQIAKVQGIRFPRAAVYLRRTHCANMRAAERHIAELLATLV
ncbi:MAG: DUF559 domain-containing protein [Thermoguttaceae bacterium]